MPDNPFKDVFKPRRPLGPTGHVATMLGIGDIADRAHPLERCVATARRAIEAGLNVIDTAPAYEAGYGEQVVGGAVRGHRDRMFVIDKIDDLHAPVAPQVEASLRQMDIEMIDLFLFHGVSHVDDWNRIVADGGGMSQLAGCVRQGKCRFRGISSHHPDVLRAAIDSGLCDVLMFPVTAAGDIRYTRDILPLAKARGIGTIGFKVFGAGKLVCDTTGYGQPLQQRPRGKISSGGTDAKSDAATALPCLAPRECVHYALTHDPDVTLMGMCFPNEQDAAFKAALEFATLSPERLDEIRALAAEAVKDKGPCWWNP